MVHNLFYKSLSLSLVYFVRSLGNVHLLLELSAGSCQSPHIFGKTRTPITDPRKQESIAQT